MTTKLIGLLDNSHQFQAQNFNADRIISRLQQQEHRVTQSRKRTPTVTKKMIQDFSIKKENAKPEGGRAYLPGLFNSNPILARKLREVEDYQTYSTSPADRTIPSPVNRGSPDRTMKGTYRYKKERFEFGKVRPACAEIDYTELPKERPTMSPTERRLLFTAQLEQMRAQQLFRHEQAKLEKQAILRKNAMESGVLMGEMDALDPSVDLSEKQREMAKQIREMDQKKRNERTQMLAFYTRTTAPLPGSHPINEQTLRHYNAPVTASPGTNGATEVKYGSKGRGKPPPDQLTHIQDEWRRPCVRMYVPHTREISPITHTLNPVYILPDSNPQETPSSSSSSSSSVQIDPPSLSPASQRRSISALGTSSSSSSSSSSSPSSEAIHQLQRERDSKATPFLENVQSLQFRSTNKYMRYPSSSESLLAQQARINPEPVCDPVTMTMLPVQKREFPQAIRTRKRHFYEQLDYGNSSTNTGGGVGIGGGEYGRRSEMKNTVQEQSDDINTALTREAKIAASEPIQSQTQTNSSSSSSSSSSPSDPRVHSANLTTKVANNPTLANTSRPHTQQGHISSSSSSSSSSPSSPPFATTSETFFPSTPLYNTRSTFRASGASSTVPDMRHPQHLKRLPMLYSDADEEKYQRTANLRHLKPSPFHWTREPGELPCT